MKCFNCIVTETIIKQGLHTANTIEILFMNNENFYLVFEETSYRLSVAIVLKAQLSLIPWLRPGEGIEYKQNMWTAFSP